MVREASTVTAPGQLRRVEINHHGFDSETHRRGIVVNADTAQRVVRIFSTLFEWVPISRARAGGVER
ncbi:hypothetical protein ACWCQS_45730 [Streptomyces sp. NPDC002076]